MINDNKEAEYLSNKLIVYLRDQLDNPEINYRAPLTRLHGGFETAIYRFQLKGAQAEYSQHLVLRLYPQFYGYQNAIWESTIQNVLVGEGFPVAKVHFICEDMSLLGGAFFIMDYIPGQPLAFTVPDKMPKILGKTHAELHKIDPGMLISSLKKRGVGKYAWSLDSRTDGLLNRASNLAWIQEGVRWLFENQPAEPENLAICHGDYHPLNILVVDEVVTGVLDWAGFVIADPAFDVANTMILITIPARYLFNSMEGFATLDWNKAAEMYLLAYQTQKALDKTNLDYYKTRRCLFALIEGFEGQKVWQHPLIIADLVTHIEEFTGIHIDVPTPYL